MRAVPVAARLSAGHLNGFPGPEQGFFTPRHPRPTGKGRPGREGGKSTGCFHLDFPVAIRFASFTFQVPTRNKRELRGNRRRARRCNRGRAPQAQSLIERSGRRGVRVIRESEDLPETMRLSPRIRETATRRGFTRASPDHFFGPGFFCAPAAPGAGWPSPGRQLPATNQLPPEDASDRLPRSFRQAGGRGPLPGPAPCAAPPFAGGGPRLSRPLAGGDSDT
jgi:hypothetical protein